MTDPAISTYEAIRARVSALIDSGDRPPVVGISGHGGAGKSTLAVRLMTDLGGTPAQVVGTDRCYARGAGPASGLFDLHDWPTIFALLRDLRTGPPSSRLVHPVRTYDGTEGVHDVSMPRVVVVEGIRLIRPETVELLDLAVWIDLSPEAAARRAVARNRDQGDSAAELDLWRTKWVPEGAAYARLVQPERLAHMIIAAADGSA